MSLLSHEATIRFYWLAASSEVEYKLNMAERRCGLDAGPYKPNTTPNHRNSSGTVKGWKKDREEFDLSDDASGSPPSCTPRSSSEVGRANSLAQV
jgi:hypothetical protein